MAVAHEQAKGKIMKSTVKSTCCYCGVGCGVLVETIDGKISGVRGDPDHPANRGRLCTKGATLNQTAPLTYRLQYPQQSLRSTGQKRRISWDTALEEAATKFADTIRAHGRMQLLSISLGS
jgi:assimilatory nitrate reductase catalytic subunit